jgi:protein-tyrosine phosphatase
VGDDLTIDVERDGRSLVVSWAGSVDELRVSPSPDEPGETVVAVDGDSRASVADLDLSSRHYVHARWGDRWVVAGERRVALDGNLNFRDLGGYPTADGRRVRWGRVYRSDGLHRLSDDDVRILDRLGVSTVCDLRGHPEVRDEPSRLADGVVRHHHPMPPSREGEPTLDDRIRAGELARVELEDVVDLYLLMLEDSAPSVGATLERIADGTADGGAVVFHCTAGKDRTGILAGLLLSLLGVDDDLILDDYLLTNRYRTEHRLAEIRDDLAARGLEVEPFTALFVPNAETLARTLDGLRSEHGSLERYVTGPAGAAPDVAERLRSSLLAG